MFTSTSLTFLPPFLPSQFRPVALSFIHLWGSIGNGVKRKLLRRFGNVDMHSSVQSGQGKILNKRLKSAGENRRRRKNSFYCTFPQIFNISTNCVARYRLSYGGSKTGYIYLSVVHNWMSRHGQ